LYLIFINSLIDTDYIGNNAPTVNLGNITVKDNEHIGIEIDPSCYYSIKGGPHPSTIQTSFTAKLIDASHRDLFLFTEGDKGNFRVYFCLSLFLKATKIQSSIGLQANLVPNFLSNFQKYNTSGKILEFSF
jgi:hypothetical protein